MKLTIVGCSGSFPGPDSPASCYLLEAPYEGRIFRLLLDLGSGALGALQSYADLRTIDAIAISHLHPDHCLDLCGYYVVRKYHPSGHLGQIPVYGPPDTASRMARAYDMPADPGMNAEFDFHVYDGDVTIGPFTLETTEVDHPVDTYALKVSHNGHSVVYSGDTGPCESLAQLAKGCDVLLAEASFLDGGDNPEHLHMSGRDAATIASAAGVGRLVLTHIPPWHDTDAVLAEASPHFDGSVVLAKPGLALQL
jgi:ribonuclease BN (tRNA processing enzyme)